RVRICFCTHPASRPPAQLPSNAQASIARFKLPEAGRQKCTGLQAARACRQWSARQHVPWRVPDAALPPFLNASPMRRWRNSMFILIFIGLAASLAVGFALKFMLDRSGSRYQIDNTELAIGSALVALLICPLTAWVGTKLAISSQVTYNENWGGYELKANWGRTTCERDRSCVHHYDCDPYTVEVECGGYEGSGKDRHYVSKKCPETRYHDCPYTTEEWTFTVDTTIDPVTVASHNLPTNPDLHRWRSYKSVPSSIESGIPQFWSECKARLDRNEPGPVTMRKEYENYVLASQT